MTQDEIAAAGCQSLGGLEQESRGRVSHEFHASLIAGLLVVGLPCLLRAVWTSEEEVEKEVAFASLTK